MNHLVYSEETESYDLHKHFINFKYRVSTFFHVPQTERCEIIFAFIRHHKFN